MENKAQRDIYDEIETALIRTALLQLREAEKAEPGFYDTKIELQKERSMQTIMRRVDLRQRQIKRRGFLHKVLPKVAVAAACVVLIGALGLTTAVAAVDSVRVKVLEFLVSIGDGYAELELKENEELSFDIPSDWPGEYFPSYIPEGYLSFEVDGISTNCDIYYQYGNDVHLSFHEYSEESLTNINTEDAEVWKETINGIDVLIIKRNERFTLVWSNETRYFVVSFTGDMAEARRVMKNVRRIL